MCDAEAAVLVPILRPIAARLRPAETAHRPSPVIQGQYSRVGFSVLRSAAVVYFVKKAANVPRRPEGPQHRHQHGRFRTALHKRFH